MFSFFAIQKRLIQLQMLVQLAEQVVLAVEQTTSADGPEKKRLALQRLVELAQRYGLDPPPLVLETAIEAAVRLTKKS